jgi:PKD repeat protein
MVPSTGYGSTYSGGFTNITAKSGVIIDSVAINMTANVPGSTWNVYMKTGTYVGSETTPAAWTKIGTNVVANVRLVGSYYRAYIKLPEVILTKGVTYGFYVTSTPVKSCSPWTLGSITGGVTTSNADVSVFQDRVSYGATEFTTPTLNYPLTWETFYRPANCPSNRVPVKVTVKPSPNGAAFIKGSVFQSTMPNTTGSKASPDIVASGDQLTYELTPPTGYTNTGYGVTWTINNIYLQTTKGTMIPKTDWSFTYPSGGSNGKLSFTLSTSFIDTTIQIIANIQDLGPHFCDSTLTRYIFGAPRPKADFKFSNTVCDGDNVIFTNASSISSGAYTNKWDFGTGNAADTANASDVVFKFPKYGTYQVKLTTISIPYGYKDVKTYSVSVAEIPKIDFKVYNACFGDSVSFVNATTISAGAITYKWDFGNGVFSSRVNPKYKYPVAGGYKVTLTASSNGCNSTMSKTAQEFARPVAKFTTPVTLCDKTDLQFTNGSTITRGNMGYTWDFGDGGVSTLANPLHTYDNSGGKVVKMRVVSEFGCADSMTKTIVLKESPLADFTYGPACNLSNTLFTFTGHKPSTGITAFNWNFAGEGSTTVENPAKLFNTVGKKPVTLTLTSDNGCSDVITKEVNVKLQSKASFDVSDICEDDDAVFVNNSTVSAGNLLYNWKFGDGKTSSSQSPRHRYNAGTSKTYNVTLVAVVPGGCSDSITKAVSVNTNPDATFTYATSGRLVDFKAKEIGATAYHWNFGGGGFAEAQNAQFHFLNYPSGKYNVCLTVTNAAGCDKQSCQLIAITGGINDISKTDGISLYPNPNNGSFTVNVNEPANDIAIEVYNINGALFKTIETNALKSNYDIRLDAAAGLYTVKITNNGTVSNYKVTITP